MPESRRRKPQTPTGARPTPPARPRRPGRILGAVPESRLEAILARAPADRLPIWLLPHLYRQYVTGAQANHCIDAALTLGAAFNLLGIPARPWPVRLLIEPDAGTSATLYGDNPRWEEDVFRGHCVLWLPQHAHFIDVTLEQFEETVGDDPLVGRAAYTLHGTQLGDQPTLDWANASGTALVRRETCSLAYTAGTEAEAERMLAAPLVHAHAAAHHRSGTNLASTAIVLFAADPETLARARAGPYPRLRTLLDALAHAPSDVDDDGNWRFLWPGPTGNSRPMLLDDIPL
ncbi:hypothetical protein [Frankia sp. Cas3]|uniref:hypothetical protein n=1 Tax=Frankia sp. Cas3 TaxID=3073926 RepID=UPI002AD2B0F0|nr:hypothetical protein [Frankia sp. Cas3]